jgi:CO/xanthine dehydrogenase FAD-binding subunit
MMASHAETAKALAGGQSLMPLMNFRLARPEYLIDLNLLSELAQTEVIGTKLAIGSMVRQRTIEHSPDLTLRLPILRHAVGFIGHPSIRHRGTIGGSLVHADPAAELPTLILGLDAELVARSARGERCLMARDFFAGTLLTSLEPDELLCEIRIPIPDASDGWSFLEISRRHGDFALAAVAVMVALDDGVIKGVRIAFGGLGPSPLRAHRSESLLLGQTPALAVFAEAAVIAATETEPPSDIHASADYRRHLATVLCRRALVEAAARASRADS